MFENPFTAAEVGRRLQATRLELAERTLDGAVFASPENVFYLTGLDHWGYFAPHLLFVPLEGEPVLVTRAMERVSIEKQVVSAEFRGHSDFADGGRYHGDGSQRARIRQSHSRA